MSDESSSPFARVDLFAGMGETALAALDDLGEDVAYEAGDHIVEQGVALETGAPVLHVITEGGATVQINGEDRDALIPGDYFGEVALFDRAVPSATIIAGPDGLAARALGRSPDFAALLGNPAFSEKLVLAFCARLRDLQLYDVAWVSLWGHVPVRGHDDRGDGGDRGEGS
jgi:CRP-like cAMP-binding protein